MHFLFNMYMLKFTIKTGLWLSLLKLPFCRIVSKTHRVLLTILQKGNFSKDHHKPPEDGPNGPKHVRAYV
jgi:hypothetical protein